MKPGKLEARLRARLRRALGARQQVFVVLGDCNRRLARQLRAQSGFGCVELTQLGKDLRPTDPALWRLLLGWLTSKVVRGLVVCLPVNLELNNDWEKLALMVPLLMRAVHLGCPAVLAGRVEQPA